MWNLWSEAKTFLTLQFEVGASNDKSYFCGSVNVASGDTDCYG